MIKYKCHSLIIGGTGQFGITLKNQLNKKNKIRRRRGKKNTRRRREKINRRGRGEIKNIQT